MKQIVRIALLVLFFAQAQAQVCAPPLNPQIITRWQDSALIAWQGPIDTFQVKWTLNYSSNVLGSISGIVDTQIVVKPLTPCADFNVQVLRECGNSFSQSTGALAWGLIPPNLSAVNIWSDSVRISWSGTPDSVQIEWAVHPFFQATGMALVDDTTAVIKLLQPCTTYKIWVNYKCGNSYAYKTSFFVTTKNNVLYAHYQQRFDNFLCGDSLFSSVNISKMKLGNHMADKARHNAGLVVPVANVNSPPSKYLIFGGNIADSNLSYSTPWVDFTGGTKDAVFFFYSNNLFNPGDNVTINVSIDNGVTNFPGVYTYSGDDSNWRKVFIDLSPYLDTTTNKIRLTFAVDQTTSSFFEFNDILLDEVFIGDTSHCSTTFYNATRPKPADLAISRGSILPQSSYQWGPVGFTPYNGQYGDTTLFGHDSLYLAGVPIGTQWLYIRDTCMPSFTQTWDVSKWYGPIEIDSISVHYLTGRVFVDNDSNCTFGAADSPIALAKLRLLNSNNYFFTNNYGEYSIPVNPGAYGVQLVPGAGGYMAASSTPLACSNDTLYYNTATTTGTIKDFVCEIATNRDIYLVNNINSVLQQGPTVALYYMVASMNLPKPDTVYVTLELNQAIYSLTIPNGHNQVAGSPNLFRKAFYVQPNSIQWGSFFVTGIVNAALLNQFDTIKAHLDSASFLESNYTNNHFIRPIKSVSAYDPNNKLVDFEGKTTAQPSTLNYRINFQNMGNYPANTVRVVDTLPGYFTYENVNILATSHNCNISIDSNNIATFLFYNIQLPDSASDPEGSKGFIDFSIALDQPMAVGDSVANRAHIFFDYQPAIITNWAWTKVVQPANFSISENGILSFRVFPNPAQSSLRVALQESGNYTVTLTDLTGSVLHTQKLQGNSTELNVQQLPNGVYLIGIQNHLNNFSGYQRFTISH